VTYAHPEPGVSKIERDRLGRQQVFVRRVGNSVRFAPTIAGLFAPNEAHLIELSREALIQYLTFQFYPAPFTPIKGVQKFEPGESLVYDAEHRRVKSRAVKPLLTFDGSDTSNATQTLLAAVRLAIQRVIRAFSSERTGFLASGGFDSTTNILSAVSLGYRPILLTAAFRDPEFDESAYAAMVAGHCSLEHRLTCIEPPSQSALEDMVAGATEPTCDRALIPTSTLFSTAAADLACIVSGEGGDEIWGPPRRWSAELDELGVDASLARAYLGRISAASLSLRGQLFGDLGMVNDEFDRSIKLVGTTFERSGARTAFEAAKALQAATWLPDNVVKKDIAAAGRQGLDVEFPLADDEVVKILNTLSAETHRELSVGKRAMQVFLESHALPALVERPKHKFKVPGHVWNEARLFTSLEQAMRSGTSELATMIGVEALSAARASGELDSRVVWGLFSLDAWYRKLVRKVRESNDSGAVELLVSNGAAQVSMA